MRVVVVGAGVLGEDLVASLVERRHDVIAIDVDAAVCDQLYAKYGVVAVNGSATDLHVLEDAGVKNADVLVTLMHYDSDNVTCALLARSLGVEQIVARMRDSSYEESYRTAGVSHLVRVTEVVRNQIVTQIEHPRIKELVGVGDRRVRIFSVEVSEGSPAIGQKVVDLARQPRFPQQCLLLGCFRGSTEELHVLHGDDSIFLGDTVLIIAQEGQIDDVMQVLVGAV